MSSPPQPAEAIADVASASAAPRASSPGAHQHASFPHTIAVGKKTMTQRHGSQGQYKWTPIFRAHGYTLVEELGKGSFGTVCRSIHAATGEEFAIKALDLQALRLHSDTDESHLRRKTSIMKQLNHVNLCRLYNVVDSPDYWLFVLELIHGQSLMDAILPNRGISVAGTRFLFRQIFTAMAYMHAKGIIHRDLKPDNILLDGIPPENLDSGVIDKNIVVKIVDFGLAKELRGAKYTFAGTPRYVAPEVLAVSEMEKRRRTGDVDLEHLTYGTPVDCYSVGIVLYVTLVGRFPLFERDSDGFERVCFELGTKVDPGAQALIRSLTHADPSRRFTMQQGLDDLWLADSEPTATMAAPASRAGAPSSSTFDSPARPSSPPRPMIRIEGDNIAQLKQSIEANIATIKPQAPSAYRSVSSVRLQLSESARVEKLLLSTAESVLNLLGDTRFAYDEGDADVVAATLHNIKAWNAKSLLEVKALKERADAVLRDGEASAASSKLFSMLNALRRFIVSIEVAWNAIGQQAEHLEGMLSVMRNPKLQSRFAERLQDFSRAWELLAGSLRAVAEG